MSDIEGSEPDWHYDEGRIERVQATNEFQIVEDLPPSPGYGVTSQAALTQFAENRPADFTS